MIGHGGISEEGGRGTKDGPVAGVDGGVKVLAGYLALLRMFGVDS